jgi:hypothetical protein
VAVAVGDDAGGGAVVAVPRHSTSVAGSVASHSQSRGRVRGVGTVPEEG